MIRRRFITKSKINIEDYCTVVALEDGWTVRMETKAYYSIDGFKWELVLARSYTPPIKMGQTISFCAVDENVSFSTSYLDSALQKCELKGNIMSLIFGYDAKNKNELLPSMFSRKFAGWKGLVSVNSNFLPFTTLADYCYYSMFSGCTSLVNAPELPATTLASYCYNSMFSDCTSLVTAPELPATTLVNNCYGRMFIQCTNLNYIKALFTTGPSSIYTQYWVSYVPSTGTFVKNPEATWEVYGVNGIPDGWKVVMDGEERVEITFYIDGVEYQAEEGMTWSDWCNDTYYSKGEWFIAGTVVHDKYHIVSINAYTYDIIVSGQNYRLAAIGGGGGGH